MEIKKSKKLLSALVATSFVGIAVTPVVLTSCSKKEGNSFKDFIKSSVMSKVKIEGNFDDDKDKNINFGDFDKNDTATLALVPEKPEANCKKFTIKLELPFEDDASDDKKSFEVSVEGKTSGLDEAKKDKKDFVEVGKKKVDDKNKKIVSWEVTITPNKLDVKKDGDKPAKFDPNVTFSEITFTFKNTKKDAKDDDKKCKFVYKITYAEKE